MIAISRLRPVTMCAPVRSSDSSELPEDLPVAVHTYRGDQTHRLGARQGARSTRRLQAQSLREYLHLW